MTRRAFDEMEHARVARPAPRDSVPDLFSQPAAEPGWATRWSSLTDAERRAQRERWKELLRPIVDELARRHGMEGITASEVQTAGVLAGVLNGERAFVTKYPRVYAWIGAWLAQLAADGALVPKVYRIEGGGAIKARRESERDQSHGNDGYVYLHPQVAA